MKKKSCFLALLLAAATAAASACFFMWENDKEPVSRTEFLLDTVCTISIYDGTGDYESILDGAFDLCRRYEGLLSATVSGSDIYRINHSRGERTLVSEDTAALISRSLEYCRLSGGEFDITILPVKSLWDFSGENCTVPDGHALETACRRVDYTKVSVSDRYVSIPDGMAIDLGGVAKGYIADRVAELLRKKGIRSAVIDLGGNVYVIGSKPDGSEWRVGIKEPFGRGEATVVRVSDKSVVTSGVYQRYFRVGDIIYHHILRPRDGMPCDTGLYSSTVIAGSSELCDALSTVCMLLGYEKSVELLRTIPDVSAVFITSDGSVLYYNPTGK